MIINKADKIVLALESELARCDSATDSLLANTSRIQGRYVETLNTVPVKAEMAIEYLFTLNISLVCVSLHTQYPRRRPRVILACYFPHRSVDRPNRPDRRLLSRFRILRKGASAWIRIRQLHCTTRHTFDDRQLAIQPHVTGRSPLNIN